MARIHGRHGSIELYTASPAVVIGSVQNWNMSQSRDYADATCFGDLNKVWIPGLRDISGSVGFVYNLNVGSPSAGDSEALFDAAESDLPFNLRLMPSTLDPTHFWHGPAYVDLSNLTVDVSGVVKGTSNYKASGAWDRH